MFRSTQSSLITVWTVGCLTALVSAAVGYAASADLGVSALLLLIGLASALIMFSLTVHLSGREAQATHQAQTDDLTGLLNRRGLFARARREWDNARRYRHSIGLLMIDLDGFKSVNDTRGHDAGDACLKDAARAIRLCAKRSTDIVARTGGDEFVVVVPNADPEGLRALGQQLRHCVDRTGMENASAVTASIGVALADAHRIGFEELLKIADQQLFAAKAAGKNKVSGDGIVAVPAELAEREDQTEVRRKRGSKASRLARS